MHLRRLIEGGVQSNKYGKVNFSHENKFSFRFHLNSYAPQSSVWNELKNTSALRPPTRAMDFKYSTDFKKDEKNNLLPPWGEHFTW